MICLGILLDTSYLIAAVSDKDENHLRSKELKKKISSGSLGKIYISDFIFDEFVTFLRAKSFDKDKVKEFGDALLDDDSIILLKITQNLFEQSWDYFKKTSGLSFTDCSTAVLCREFKIKFIASFDSGFDKINFIERI